VRLRCSAASGIFEVGQLEALVSSLLVVFVVVGDKFNHEGGRMGWKKLKLKLIFYYF